MRLSRLSKMSMKQISTSFLFFDSVVSVRPIMGIYFKVKKHTDNLGIFSEKGFDTCIIFWGGGKLLKSKVR